MALLYYRTTANLEASDVEIRAIDDNGYSVALTFPGDDDDDQAVTEILLTKEEVEAAYDLIHNR